MESYLFPIEYKENNHWDERMINNWKDSKLPYLSFTFNKFRPKTIPSEPFWLYLYYCKGSTDEKFFKSRIRFRFYVFNSSDSIVNELNIYSFPPGLNPKKWFLCSKLEEIRISGNDLLTLYDFRHFEEKKKLYCCLHNSIPHVICKKQIEIVNCYP